LEESNLIFENLLTKSNSSIILESTSESIQQDPLTLSPEEESLLKEDITLSEWINEEAEEREDHSAKSNHLNIEEESNEDTEEDSVNDAFPQKGDKVKIKYEDGWHMGRVKSISKKKDYFWVEFKGYDDLFKVRKEEKFNII
jgi:hypothetical protein